MFKSITFLIFVISFNFGLKANELCDCIDYERVKNMTSSKASYLMTMQKTGVPQVTNLAKDFSSFLESVFGGDNTNYQDNSSRYVLIPKMGQTQEFTHKDLIDCAFVNANNNSQNASDAAKQVDKILTGIDVIYRAAGAHLSSDTISELTVLMTIFGETLSIIKNALVVANSAQAFLNYENAYFALLTAHQVASLAVAYNAPGNFSFYKTLPLLKFDKDNQYSCAQNFLNDNFYVLD
jgi:hypothetical protein